MGLIWFQENNHRAKIALNGMSHAGESAKNTNHGSRGLMM